MLADGRILFVSAISLGPAGSGRGLSLFTINNDGTEITAFACQHDPPARHPPAQTNAWRPASPLWHADLGSAVAEGSAECVRMARPFLSRAKLFPGLSAPVRSVVPEGEGGFLVCAKDSHSAWAVYRLGKKRKKLGAPLLEDPNWDCVEALVAHAVQRPMGRISSMDPAKKTGQILCLNANDTTYGARRQDRARPPPGFGCWRKFRRDAADRWGRCRSRRMVRSWRRFRPICRSVSRHWTNKGRSCAASSRLSGCGPGRIVPAPAVMPRTTGRPTTIARSRCMPRAVSDARKRS